MVVHTGFSEFYQRPSMVEDCLSFLRLYPGIRVVLAHMLFLDMPLPNWADLLAEYPHLYLDATNILPYTTEGGTEYEQLRDLLYGHSDRIIFGTDFPMGTLYPTGKLHDLAIGICPNQESLDNFMWRTACGLVGLDLDDQAKND
jgi:predicted TIM-barrel fold metal-dependent hydrolase